MLQIINTWKCNYKCEHCMFSCGPDKKGFVSKTNFLDFVKEYSRYDNEFVNLIGGEPFLHPDIAWQIQVLTWNFNSVRIVTNGSVIIKKDYEELYELFSDIDTSKLHIQISDDCYHEVFWKNRNHVNYCKLILSDFGIKIEKDTRRMNNYIIPLGRAKRNGIEYSNHGWSNAECFDEEYRFDPCLLPDGSIASCCNGRLVVGTTRDSYETCSERFHDYMKKRRKPYTCDKCYKCPKSIINR